MTFSSDNPQFYVKKKKFDNFFIGLSFAIIIPITIIFIVSYNRYPNEPELIDSFMRFYNNYDFTNYFLLSIFPNLFMFFFLYKTERWKSAYGLVVAIILLIMALILKL